MGHFPAIQAAHVAGSASRHKDIPSRQFGGRSFQVQQVPLRASPSLFYFAPRDSVFRACAWLGVGLSLFALSSLPQRLSPWAAASVWAVLWLLYLSFVNIGQTFYGFGWETLLCEVGFFTIFAGSSSMAPNLWLIWIWRWTLFRLMFGAGLIKLRGDACWRDLSCLDYHHETQPMPGPMSWFFHHLPKPLHRVEVAGNHFAQLVVPFALFAPQPVASMAAAIVMVTQLWLVLSGNFAWLNWLTIILACSAIDHSAFASVLPVPAPPAVPGPPLWFAAVVIAFTAVTVALSFWPVRNMVSSHQRMNAAFNPIHLINTYGAFGSVGRTRLEVVIEGTDEPEVTEQTLWKEYGFKGKPGDPHRWPRQWAPYHLRLDWLMWFAALTPHHARDWLGPFVIRLLQNDAPTLRLLRHNPFPESPPRYVRAQLYEYRFTSWDELRRERLWWRRTVVGEYLPPIALGTGQSVPHGLPD